MHIKELRIDSFKSFGRPTTIPFYEGFTTISGPNGSGKSNLIDSVLFALGLARTRGMRAEKLPDLLYDPPAGESANEAYVEVVLDNSDRAVEESEIKAKCGEVEHPDEIVIKRRIKETSANYYSYYYINGRSVNLSDIQDLLANAGITPEGYNVVMQGDVTSIIQMSSTERRGIIEEAAGVAEFDDKKEKAHEELDTVDERVEKTELILEEIEERLDKLKDERDKALKYKELRDQKQEQEKLLSAAKLQQVEDEIESVLEKTEREEEKKEGLEDDLEDKQERVDELKAELKELNQEINRKGEDERLALKEEIEELKGEVSRRENRIEDAEDALDEYEKKKREAFVGADKAREELDELEDKIKKTKVRKSSLKSDLKQKEDELEEVEERIEEVEGEYADVRSELDSKKDEVEGIKEEKNEKMREKDRLLDDARRRSREIEEIEDEIEKSEKELGEIRDEKKALKEELEKSKSNLEELESVKSDLKKEKRELQDDLGEIEDSLREKQEEFAQAQAQQDSGSNYGRAVSTILNADMRGVHGTVADLGSVDQRYATAVETAAGGRMAHVVVDDDGVGQRCIEYLKKRNAGRATFLPLTKMENRSLSSSPLSKDGVIDYAYNLVDFDQKYAPAFSYVFGDTLVVEDIETARDMMGRYRMVTLDGDLVEKSGAMTGGSKRESRYSFGGGETKMERLADKIDELEEERRSIKEDISDVNQRLDDVRDRLNDTRNEVERRENRISDLDDEAQELEKQIESKEERLEEIEDEKKETREKMEVLEEEIEDKEEEIDDLEERVDELKRELEESPVSDLSEKADKLRDEVNEIESNVREVDSELNELELEKGYKEDKIEEFEETIRELDRKRDQKESLIDDLRDEIEELEEEIEDKRDEVSEIEDEIGELKEERDEVKEKVERKVEERDAVKRRIDKSKDKLSSLRSKVNELEEEASELREDVEEIEEEYGKDELPDYDDVKADIDEIEEEMEELEPVNMLAIEEYDEVKNRQDDLQDRMATLQDEKEEILERIEKYERLKRETFMEAFNEINEHFEDIFSRLSDGSGKLVLENEEDPFESGMTIEAKPRNKPVKRLEQMSGGERSLTALSFIFAVQRYTPAPFYAFDEVDMFLDAPNAERVAEMIDDISDDTQFIVVSLRNPMIERAERTVGVTMQENNVSTVTGVKLNEQDPPEAD